MKVLLCHFAELGSVGGVETVVRQLSAGLRARGHQAGVVETTNGVTGKRLLSDIPVWSVKSSTYPVYQRPRSWASFARSTGQFLQVLRDFKPNIVNVHFPCSQALPVIGARLLPHDWRMVVTLHGSEIRNYPHTEPHFKDWQRRLLQRAEVVTAVSQSLLDDAIALYPFIQNKSQIIHNGLEEAWLEAVDKAGDDEETSAPYLLYVGRLHQVKGVDILLKAWAKIHSLMPETILRLVGDGPEMETLKSLAEELGITRFVEFTGAVSRERLAPLYRKARLVIMPSRSEGFPLTLLEAGACGALSLATRVGGIPEVIENGRTGFLVEPESVDALAAAIEDVMQLSEEERARIRKAARARVEERFSQEKIVSEYLELFTSMLSGSGATSRRAS